MKNKPRRTTRKGTLHIGEMIQITDPAEQAALDRRCREAEKQVAARKAETRKAKPRKGK